MRKYFSTQTQIKTNYQKDNHSKFSSALAFSIPIKIHVKLHKAKKKSAMFRKRRTGSDGTNAITMALVIL